MVTKVRAYNYVKIKMVEFPASTKNSNGLQRLCKMLMLLCVHVTNVLFLVQFNKFALTMGFYWSYTLLL